MESERSPAAAVLDPKDVPINHFSTELTDLRARLTSVHEELVSILTAQKISTSTLKDMLKNVDSLANDVSKELG